MAGRFIRRIGIDFGMFSTSISYMDYEIMDEDTVKPVSMDPVAIKFNQIYLTIPSVVQIKGELPQTSETSFGREAISKANRYPELIRRRFKGDFSECGITAQSEFFKRLYEEYRYQVESCTYYIDKEITIVNVPTGWGKLEKDKFLGIIQEAGFSNISLKEESQAVLKYCSIHGYMDPCAKVLLIDTTDSDIRINLYEYKLSNKWIEKIKLLHSVSAYGGEIDDMLFKHIKHCFDGMEGSPIEDGKLKDICCKWKERTLEPALNANTVIKELPVELGYLSGSDFIGFDRKNFMEVVSNYIQVFSGALAEFKDYEINSVILYGGGRQWYFLNDLLKQSLNIENISIKVCPDNIISLGFSLSAMQETRTLSNLISFRIESAITSAAWAPDSSTISILNRSSNEEYIYNLITKSLDKKIINDGLKQKIEYYKDEKYFILSYEGALDLYERETSSRIGSTSNLNIRDFCISKDKKFIAAKGDGGKINIINTESFSCCISLQADISYLTGFMEFSGDNRSLASSYGGNIVIWDLNTEQRQYCINTASMINNGELLCGAYAGDSELIAGTSDGSIYIIDLASQSVKQSARNHKKPVNSLKYSRKHGLIASCSEDGRVLIMKKSDLSDFCEIVNEKMPFTCVSFSPDESCLLMAGYGGVLEVWLVEGLYVY